MDRRIKPLTEKAAKVIANDYSKEQLEELKRTLPEYIYAPIEKIINKQKYKDVTDLLKFHEELKIFFMNNYFRFYLGNLKYKLTPNSQNFFAEDIKHAPYDEIPFHKFYIFDNIGDILFNYLPNKDKHLLIKALYYYPLIREKNPELWDYTYNFGKKKKKKLSSNIKKKCKKKGIRLTYKRNGKRVYKTEKVLKKQLANRS